MRGTGIAVVGGAGISLTLFALSWLAVEGDRGMLDVGLVLTAGRVTTLSARDLNCSDRLRPSPERLEKSEIVLGLDCMLACVLAFPSSAELAEDREAVLCGMARADDDDEPGLLLPDRLLNNA